LQEQQERVLALLLLQFPALIYDLHEHVIINKEYNPSALTHYLYLLAQETNTFYQTYRVLQTDAPELLHARAALLGAVKQVFEIGLSLCHISIPTKM